MFKIGDKVVLNSEGKQKHTAKGDYAVCRKLSTSGTVIVIDWYINDNDIPVDHNLIGESSLEKYVPYDIDIIEKNLDKLIDNHVKAK